MKLQIRKNIFETNSSSVHAITVTTEPVREDALKYASIEFHTGEFGWEHRAYYNTFDKASYLWTAIVHNFIKEYVSAEYDKDNYKLIKGGYIILDTENERYINIREAIRSALVYAGLEDDGWNIRFQENFNDEYSGPDDGGYIDHCPELDFVEALVFDRDRLLRFLFNDNSAIYTWNDNEWYYEGEDEDDENAPDYDKDPEGWSKYWDDKDWKHFGIDPDDHDIEWKYMKEN